MSTFVEDAWQSLRSFTDARIAQGRSGASLPTAPMLAFQLAHARARDAVHLPLDVQGLRTALGDLEVVEVASAAASRDIYLRRPDLGRRLDDSSRARLETRTAPELPYDVVFVLADGLSALATQQHAAAVSLLARAALAGKGWHIGPLVIAKQARVALGDEIGELLGARQVAMLIGERPGLSAADSLGIYLTWTPRVGRKDAERNCISNIRPAGGLSYEQAAHKLLWLMGEARARRLTGVALKDESDAETELETRPVSEALPERGEG
ncbi:ethanolamine ammonia-lyase subunit EutC [Uliginosibacterium sp. H3]|uniref:Ethanolamine ammonia-lyase small subunit n=1 Tax=Uliginosibacterium silvisoli TaxID=3114758 RepID=A0ABU6K2H8_9RHOO|nr:ethanolamine ammonia-lyase subunit EutC [Uliginosibacterium sp. H3]